MHVLLIPSCAYNPRWNPLSGIFVKNQAEALNMFGIRVGVISSALVPWSQTQYKVDKEFLKNPDFPVCNRFFSSFIPGRLLRRFRPSFQNKHYEIIYNHYTEMYGEPDIIHAHNALNAGVFAQYLHHKVGKPFVVTEHSSDYGRSALSRHQIDAAKTVFTSSSANIAVSHAQKNIIDQLFDTPDLVEHVIPNVIPFYLADGSPNHANSTERSSFTFINVGRLDTNKNQKLLLESFAASFSGNPFFKLKLCGDGKTKAVLQNLCSDLGIADQVQFLGQLPHSETLEHIRSSDVLVHTSFFETFCVVLIEALALGKPVISTKSGGPYDIVTEQNGLLADFHVQDLSIKLKYIYNNYSSYDFSKISSDCLSKYGPGSLCAQLMSVYNGLL